MIDTSGDQGGSQKRFTKGVTVFKTIFVLFINLLSIKSLNVDDFHVSVAINRCNI